MKGIYPLVAVLLLALVAYLGVAIGLEYLFGVIIPYVSVILFLGGFIWKIYDWVKSPVPFRIPTTCGQAKSLEWIKRDELESPSGFWGVFGRMSLEVLFCFYKASSGVLVCSVFQLQFYFDSFV